MIYYPIPQRMDDTVIGIQDCVTFKVELQDRGHGDQLSTRADINVFSFTTSKNHSR